MKLLALVPWGWLAAWERAVGKGAVRAGGGNRVHAWGKAGKAV